MEIVLNSTINKEPNLVSTISKPPSTYSFSPILGSYPSPFCLVLQELQLQYSLGSIIQGLP
jgi:hypothetical protein